jgi:glycosyltransferase involved in cell wall biosynthesis
MSIDVIVPCHNYGRFVGEALHSIANQSRRADRVIVIDDGSTDDSLDVLHRLRERLDFELLTQPNAGLVSTMRRGIAASTSELFAVVSSDDRLHPRFLEATSRALETEGRAGYCYTDLRFFGMTDKIERSAPFDPGRLVYQGNYISGGAMLRRSSYARTRGYQALPALEDWDLWLSFLDVGLAGAYVPEPLYEYRQHGPSRNTLSSRRELLLRRRIQARHPRLLWKYAAEQVPSYVERHWRNRF